MDNVSILIVCLFLFMVLTITGSYNIQQMHSGGFYRTEAIYEDLGPVIYYEEGLYATVTVRETLGVGKALFINGKGQGSHGITDLRVNFLLSYLPLLINPEIEDALVIGLGTGTTSGQLAKNVDTTTIEIEPEIINAVPYFNSFNANVLENKNHELIIGDGRNYLLKNKEKYDVIVPEPSDPWQSFSTALFSQEFLELAAENLGEKGFYVQWVPIYQMSTEDFMSFYKTFDSVFPYNAAFANIKPTEDTPIKFGTSEIVIIGSKEKFEFGKDSFNRNYEGFSEESKRQLNSLRLDSGEDIYNLILFTDEQIEGYTDSAKIITDDKPILEFSTAKNVLNQNPEAVINDINNYLEERNG